MEIVLIAGEKVDIILEGADGMITVEWVQSDNGQSLRVKSDLPDYKGRVGIIYDSDNIDD